MKCQKCQTDNPDTQSFCGDCGTKLGSDKQAPAFTKTLETPYPRLSEGMILADRYEIQGELGKGGMGEVYLAEDTNLKRQVAIKVLPQQFAVDEERSARFEREARLLASLNHPNIATIHGLEKSESLQFLVMELVEGETLREIISKGPLPVEESLEICKQIAEGLEAAHEKGIIHRDLKPSNIKVTPEGKLKILDFGIAKVFQDHSDNSDISEPREIAEEMTSPGMILGTAAYMSPEQAKGKRVDKRTDIWAFGCILFECLTGRRAFEGEIASETIVAILKDEPEWVRLPIGIQASIRALIQRCLRKDKNRRQHDISDARIEIEDALLSPRVSDQIPTVVKSKFGRHQMILLIFGAILITAIVTAVMTNRLKTSPTNIVVRSEIGVEPANRIGGSSSTEQRAGYWRPSRTAFTLASDGTFLVFEGVRDSEWQLYRRDLGSEQAEPIANTEGGRDPFFSTDGKQIGFWAYGKLMKIPTGGGMAVPILDCPCPHGSSWGPDDLIIYSGGRRLFQSVDGGKPEILSEPKQEEGDMAHILPHILPSGDSVLFSIRTSPIRWYNTDIGILSLKTKKWERILEDGSDARYSPTGHIVFMRQGTLWAVPFSLSQLKTTGEPKPVIADVMHASNATNGDINCYAGQFSFSETGILAYAPGGIYPSRENFLVQVDENGITRPLIESADSYRATANISPDHNEIAYITWGRNQNVWIYNRNTNTTRSLSQWQDRYDGSKPLWVPPDGKRVIYRHSIQIYIENADGSGEPEKLLDYGIPSSLSPDGKLLAFLRWGTDTNRDIWVISIEDKVETPLLVSKYREHSPIFSPNGKFVAYSSDRTGQREVYVTPYPGASIEIPVSNNGGSAPVWSPDMSQLYYLEISQSPRARMIAVDIRTSPSFQVVNRSVLFDCWGLHMRSTPIRGYEIHPDGQSFICTALFYGGSPVQYSDIPQDILSGINIQDNRSLAWFERWLKEDKDRIFSPELERRLEGQIVTRIKIVQNWFEELEDKIQD